MSAANNPDPKDIFIGDPVQSSVFPPNQKQNQVRKVQVHAVVPRSDSEALLWKLNAMQS